MMCVAKVLFRNQSTTVLLCRRLPEDWCASDVSEGSPGTSDSLGAVIMVVESKGKGGRKGGKGSGKGAGAGSGSSRPRKQARLTDTGRGGKNKGGARAPNGGAGKYKKRGKFSKGSGRPSKKPALTKEQKKVRWGAGPWLVPLQC